MSKCRNCLSEEICRYNDGHNLYCKEDYVCPHFKNYSEWVHLPCKVGDFVFVIYGREIQSTKVFSIKVESENDHYMFYCKCMVHQGGARFEKFVFGKTVFLTREEAEKALEEKI